MRPAAALALLFWIGCHSASAGSAPPAGPDRPAPALANTAPQDPLPRAVVTLHGKSGAVRFAVELALDPASQERGLMFRKEIPEGSGMLFVFASDGPRTFWMKNTLVPLDMLFISAAGRVVGLIENAEPLTQTPRRGGRPARYVLELAGGTAFARGLRVGDAVEFEGLP